MNGAEVERPGSSTGTVDANDSNSKEAARVKPGAEADGTTMTPPVRAEKLAFDIGRFSSLSSELTELLTSLARDIQVSAEELNRIVSTVELKKKELNTIRKIEASAAALERLVEDHRQQKESFDRLMQNQRALWEEEKAKRAEEERQYLENLRMRRQRDEEEHRQKWAAEKLKAQQKLEQELREIQQESLEKQQAIERECLERESALKQKELEWVQLIQELEQFMSKLIRRTQVQTAGRPSHAAEQGARQPVLRPDGSDFPFGDGPGWGIGPEERKSAGGGEPLFGSDLTDEPEAAISSLKDMLVSQGRRIESLHAEPERQDSVTGIQNQESD